MDGVTLFHFCCIDILTNYLHRYISLKILSNTLSYSISDMNIQFNTSDRHNGTIKPVKSSTGKHAGKWVCRIHGPGLSSKCKTVYSAPYIGAAKAAIAKYLNITVSEVVEVVPTSCATQGGGGTAAVHHEEFDDGNDEDFANFDLNAAVTSARNNKRHPNTRKRSVQAAPTKMYPIIHITVPLPILISGHM